MIADANGHSGIRSSEALLERAGPKAGRDALAAETGISGKLLLEWVNACDLIWINGIGAQFSDLLEAAGVDSALPSSRNGTRQTWRRHPRSSTRPAPRPVARRPRRW